MSKHQTPPSTTASTTDSPTGTEDTDAAAFTAEDLRLSYEDSAEPVIDGESLAVASRQVTALVGPNGSGKSTLLKGLADQLDPDEGVVRLDGREIREVPPKDLARKLGLLTQENTAPTGLRVEKLVEHGRYPHRGFLDGLDQSDVAAIDRAIDLAGIDHLREREVGSLSGGQKQLVWIAMALAQETDVLLLDEPTTFLDLHHQLEVMEILETLRDESDMTVVVVLHDIQQAARHADYMLAMSDGEIRARGTPDDVVTEDLLADVFGIDAAVTETPHGPQITPLQPLHDDGADSHL